VAREHIEDAKQEGIDYLNLRFRPWFMAEPHGLDPREVIEGVVQGDRGRRQGRQRPREPDRILSRTYGVEIAHQELEALLAYRENFVALDLVGDEANSRRHRLSNISRKAATPAGASRFTPAKREAAERLGMRSDFSVRNESGTTPARPKNRRWPISTSKTGSASKKPDQ
jgi:adenosine deaminase